MAMLLFSMASYAQGNLQFNQVLNIKNGDTYTVPAGKTLKIESLNSTKFNVNLQLSSCTNNGGNWFTCNYIGNVNALIIGGVIFNTGTISTGINPPNNQCSQCPLTYDVPVNGINYGFLFPIWLKSGEVISVISSSGNAGILISAIEFNIVQ
jgi:hypothetical protein